MLLRDVRPDFRHDIHALRGISVLLVVAFHFGVPGAAGGYLGVDIFFVISGYLITQLLLRERERSGSIDLVAFYARRIKRILPAALLVLVLFGCFAIWLLPARGEGFAQEMRWSSVALGNIFYAQNSGYFALAAEEFLFLNYWSLAVEEQFYLLWPILLFFVFRANSGSRKIIGYGIGAALAVLTVLSWSADATSAFFHLWGRGWELGAGCVLAIWEQSRGQSKGRWPLLALGLLALVLALAVESFAPHWPAPLSMALVVTGTTSLIASGAGEPTSNRLITKGLLSFFGSISYSLYLVHWPLKTLAFLWVARPLGAWELAACFAASVIISTALFLWVENPIRFGSWRRRSLYGGAFLALSLTMATALIMPKMVFHLMSGPEQSIAEYADIRGRLQKTCLASTAQPYPGVADCRFGAPNDGSPDFWLVGDSHDEHWQAGLEALAIRHGLTGALHTKNARLPIFDIEQIFHRPDVQIAKGGWRETLRKDLATAEPAVVILSARWGLYTQTQSFGPDGGKRYFATKTPGGPQDPETTLTVITDALHQTVREIQAMGHSVVLLGQVPELGVSKIDCVGQRLSAGQSWRDCATSTAEMEDYSGPATELLTQVANETGAALILPSDFLCGKGHCALMIGQRYIYRDDDHLSRSGSVAVMEIMSVPILDAMTAVKNAPDVSE